MYLSVSSTSLNFATQSARSTFGRAHRRATLQVVRDRLRGRHGDLLSLKEAPRGLPYHHPEARDIPLDAVIGSVGRCGDFTRAFLPKHRHLETRWLRVWELMESPQGVPAIEVYRVGDIYFVLDGHHRVSVARRRGFRMIQAYVTELRPLAPGPYLDDASCEAAENGEANWTITGLERKKARFTFHFRSSNPRERNLHDPPNATYF